MADTIKIPGVGTVPKKYALMGGGVVVVIVGVAYYRHRNAPQVPAASTAPSDGTYTDPTAGSTLPSGYLGDSGYYPSGGTPYAPYGYDVYGNPLPASTGLGSGGVYTTNLDWANAAESQLELSGVSQSVSGTAISKVLAGLAVTSDQKNIFLEAVGLLGQPPQGYPTPIKVSDPTGTPGGTTAPSGSSLPAPSGLHAASVGKTTVRIEWKAVPGAKGYAVYDVADPAGGGTPTGVRQQSVVYTNYNKAGLKPNTRYRFDVHALGADNKLGARARIYVTTHK
ncbi:fibronectin type III domain-containing protein [Actinomadura violacea]|uniref:Fibronectin type III domain-containing protein n=1 Tax=Actinomadura violacea TaxID=2819934 RepID=A0ABS3RXG5_9ACTN|nr:fibronectin type III domain-containing protein [Actinomadura violacea]MBO2460973.1 fibronectin type III domain-containing protein [Actinomadura violacea]